MPLVATRGAASAQGFGEFAVAATPTYIEDVFSCFVYTGNSSTQTITNGIDLSTKGGLVWFKSRSGTYGTQSHVLTSNELTNWTEYLSSNTTGDTAGFGASAFTPSTTGFALNSVFAGINDSGTTYVSWTFRKQAKFFDVVTWTGSGSNTTIAHNLGSVPGCIIVKRTDSAGYDWRVYHRGLTSAEYSIQLNATTAQGSGPTIWNSTAPTSTVFSVGTNASVNASGGTYVAYVFAHDAGGFGLTGTDNVISCGSFTTDGSGNATVNLGYEPQWVLVKRTNTVESWQIIDNMRGWPVTPVAGNYAKKLIPNSTAAEADTGEFPLTNTGFNATGIGASNTYIYIAIRRGPMKVPTLGTSVFAPFYASYSEGAAITTNFPIDLSLWKGDVTYSWSWQDRLRGTPTSTGSGGPALASNSTAAETTSYTAVGITKLDSNTRGSVSYQADSGRSNAAAYFMLRRAPSFFDEVCYTGTGVSSQTFNHNLGVVPELMIVKCRSQAAGGGWVVYSQALGNNSAIILNSSGAAFTPTAYWNTTSPTSSVFSVNADTDVGNTGRTYVAYLFATCAGVSKVGSYTGNGSTQQINCGFTGGARFVMIKQTSGSGGDWVVYSSALGINAGTDSYVLFNSNTGVNAFGDTIDAFSAGFELGPNSSGNGTNENGQTYIFLAIA